MSSFMILRRKTIAFIFSNLNSYHFECFRRIMTFNELDEDFCTNDFCAKFLLSRSKIRVLKKLSYYVYIIKRHSILLEIGNLYI